MTSTNDNRKRSPFDARTLVSDRIAEIEATGNATTPNKTQSPLPPFSAQLHLPLANAYWHQGVRSWTRCRHLAVEHMVPVLTTKGNGDSIFGPEDPPHFSPEYPAFLRKEIFKKDHDADPGNNPFPVDGGDLACIFEAWGGGVTYVAIRPEWDRMTIMGGMGRGGVKSEWARRDDHGR